jgi:hypothetical protein
MDVPELAYKKTALQFQLKAWKNAFLSLTVAKYKDEVIEIDRLT